MRRASIAISIALVAGCGDTTPEWELDHARIVAVRATPPHVPAGARAGLDALVTAPDAGPSVVPPIGAQVVPASVDQAVPPELAGAVVFDADGWAVIAPDEAALASARATLGLAAGDPVPLRVGLAVEVGGEPLAAVKTVYLGDAIDNPALGAVTVDGHPIADGAVVPAGIEVALAVEVRDADRVDWLTSLGELSDADDAAATLVPDAATSTGGLVVIVRDAAGGVAWGSWALEVR